MKRLKMILSLTAVAAAVCLTVSAAEEKPYWLDAMKEVHGGFNGTKGYVAQFGDSITYSMAFWTPVGWMNPDTFLTAEDGLPKRPAQHRWRDIFKGYNDKGPKFANYSGWRVGDLLGAMDAVLKQQQPEAAMIMVGSNDMKSDDGYRKGLEQVVERCMAAHCVPILNTIPPRRGHLETVEAINAVIKETAAKYKVPLVDYYAEILQRQPGTAWDGTLISKDGVHPSGGKNNDFSAANLSQSGYALRTWVNFKMLRQVYFSIFAPDDQGRASAPAPAPKAVPQAALVPDWYPKAPPLPKPRPGTQVILAATVDQIYEGASRLQDGGTMLVADGHYAMPASLYIKANNGNLRSASGDRTKVVLDFAGSRHQEGVCISEATGVTIADLTVQNVSQNGIKINSDRNVQKVTIYNVFSHNVWQRHVKGVKVPDVDGRQQWINDCRIQYCLFKNDRRKRHGDDPYEDGNKGGKFQYNYVGAIDTMASKGWVICDNVFAGIQGKTGEGRGAIFVWHSATDLVVERNIIVDCDTGICLGNSSARGERRHAVNCVVRNNFITRCPETGIFAAHTRDCVIVNNTVHDPESRLRRLIRVIFANDGLLVKNNIFSGPGISVKDVEGEITIENNLVKTVTDYFVDPAQGNLHLTAKAVEAIGQGVEVAQVTTDIDGAPRGNKPDLGADEL